MDGFANPNPYVIIDDAQYYDQTGLISIWMDKHSFPVVNDKGKLCPFDEHSKGKVVTKSGWMVIKEGNEALEFEWSSKVV
jgi:hypothetical protein